MCIEIQLCNAQTIDAPICAVVAAAMVALGEAVCIRVHTSWCRARGAIAMFVKGCALPL